MAEDWLKETISLKKKKKKRMACMVRYSIEDMVWLVCSFRKCDTQKRLSVRTRVWYNNTITRLFVCSLSP